MSNDIAEVLRFKALNHFHPSKSVVHVCTGDLSFPVDSLAMVMNRLLYKLPIENCLIFPSKESLRSGFAVECLPFVCTGTSTVRRRNGNYPFVSWKCCFSFKHSNSIQQPQSSNDFRRRGIAFFALQFFRRIFYARFKFKAANSMTLLFCFTLTLWWRPL